MAQTAHAPTHSARFISSIYEIDQQVWDNLNKDDHPFSSFAFLSALEDSGSLGKRSGWHPHYLVLEQQKDKQDTHNIVGLMPSYIKTNSWGEYVFDHSWADAYHHAGGQYYPKLQVSVPFSPVTGPRFLGEDRFLNDALNALQLETKRQLLSSAHITFTKKDFVQSSEWIRRTGYQFHWRNLNSEQQKYRCFDDFLASLTRKKRKNIKRERTDVKDAGIKFEHLTGPTLTQKDMDQFYVFYLSTIDKKWSADYLRQDFFQYLIERMSDQILLVQAKKDNQVIAAALNVIGHDRLFGRYWGCQDNFKFLHFETCYYQAIDYAIENDLDVVEAGAQGPHKISRGYLPTKTYSFHYLAHEGFDAAIRDFIKREDISIKQELLYFRDKSPFQN